MGNSCHALLSWSSAVSAMLHCSTAGLWQLRTEPAVGLSCTAQCGLPGGSLARVIDCLHTLPSGCRTVATHQPQGPGDELTDVHYELLHGQELHRPGTC